MSVVKLTAPAFFYVAMSSGLNHGHSFWFEHSELTADGMVLVDIPLVGSLDCHQSDWSEERQEYTEREVVLGIREVHMLHQLQGRLVNRESMDGALAGLEGWEATQDTYQFSVSHQTATRRLRLGLVSNGWGTPSSKNEEIFLEVCAGDGKTVAGLIWRDGKWERWYGAANGMHTPDHIHTEAWLPHHNANHRPDRFWALAEILFDGEGNYLLPGESLAQVEHWGVGAAIRACLNGTAFDVADAHKASLPQEEPKPFDPMEAFE